MREEMIPSSRDVSLICGKKLDFKGENRVLVSILPCSSYIVLLLEELVAFDGEIGSVTALATRLEIPSCARSVKLGAASTDSPLFEKVLFSRVKTSDFRFCVTFSASASETRDSWVNTLDLRVKNADCPARCV